MYNPLMNEFEECIVSRLDIMCSAVLEGGVLGVAFKYKSVKLYDIISCKTLQNLHIELLNHTTTAVTFHTQKPLLALANGNVISIVSTQDASTLQSIRTYDDVIDVLYFIENSPYLVAGTLKGRADLYRIDGFSKLSRLCSFPLNREKVYLKNNYINTFTSKEGILVCSGHGGGITMLRPYSLTNKQSVRESSYHFTVLHFTNPYRVLCGDVSGGIHRYDTRRNTLTYLCATPYEGIDFLLPVADSSALLIGSKKSQNIALFDLKENKIIKKNYIQCKDTIAFLDIFEDMLLIALQNGLILKQKLQNTQSLSRAIKERNFSKAYEQIEQNPLLHNTKEAAELEAIYKKLYTNAKEGLIASNPKELQKLQKLLRQSQQKSQELEDLARAFKEYERFKTLYRDKKFPLALVLADKFPPLQGTPIYHKIEEKFKADFAFAQKQIHLQNTPLAQEILGPYMMVSSKKALITLLLRENKTLIQYLQALQQKDYKTVCQLAQKNKLFEEVSGFRRLQQEIHTTIKDIYGFIDVMELDKAKKLLKKIHNIPQMQEQLKDIYFAIQEAQRLLHYYDTNNFKTCYEILDNTPLLYGTTLGKLLEKHWKKLVDKGEIFALSGDIKNIKKSFDELLFIQTRRAKIGDLLRLSFYTKIKQLLAKRAYKNAENIIYSFIDIFGIDDDLELLIQRYEKRSKTKIAITLNEESHKDRDAWIRSDLF